MKINKMIYTFEIVMMIMTAYVIITFISVGSIVVSVVILFKNYYFDFRVGTK